MPVGNIFIRDTRGNVKHDDTTLALNVVSVSKTTELFLSCSVPHVEANCAEVGVERERMHLNTESSCKLLG